MTQATNWRQLTLVKRSDRVNTPHMLLIGRAARLLAPEFSEEQAAELLAVPVQGGVSAPARLAEASRVVRFWEQAAEQGFGDLLSWAATHGAPWHALVEPATWAEADPTEVFGFVDRFLHQTARWPSVGQTRRRFGRISNHRGPADDDNQGILEAGQ